MRSRKLSSILLAALLSIVTLPLSAQETVEQWDCFELSFSAPATANPFVGVAFSAVFEKDGQRFEPEGFYDGNDVFKIRFMPNEPGTWTYRTQSNYAPLHGKSGSFTCTPASEGNHGPVQVRKQYHFGYADGTPFRPYGTTSYEWWYQPEEMREQTLATLEASPFNKLRFLVIPNFRKEYYKGGSLELDALPFVGDSRETFDFSRFNPVFFQRLEENVLKLQDLGIEADLILFRPYDNAKWGFDQMSRETNDRYLRYMVARFAAYRNVWWCLANEHSFIDHLEEGDWDHFFQVVQAHDPYAHLRSVQNAEELYDFNKPWVTHVAFHNYMAIQHLGVPSVIRSIYRKPVIHDEINYEGDIDSRWGQLSSEEMTYRFWVGTMGGTYVTHGETKRGEIGDGWISRGGTLTRQSPARIGFLKDIVTQSGLSELEPIDPAFESNIAGEAGKNYLIYLGKDEFDSWPFVLPRNGLEPGMRFKVDLIDTWDMTITPVEQTFEVERSARYQFADKDRRSIALPAKPYMALRIQRITE